MFNMNYHVCVFLFKGSKHVYISLEAASIVVTLHSNTPSAILVHPMGMANKGWHDSQLHKPVKHIETSQFFTNLPGTWTST